MDTIFALASARGKAGVSVVRVSGPNTDHAVKVLCGDLPPLRRASVRKLYGSNRKFLDEALVIRFPQGGSFTGEAVAEFQLHGSSAVVAAVLSELGLLNGLRHAEAGEFTRRALENERLDLAQVEGLADLIEAETEAQRVQAMRVFSGALGSMVDSWRDRLIRAAALIEATIDFADEEVPVDVEPEVSDLLSGVARELAKEAAGSQVAERIRDGFEVAIVGRPNVGKSTLLNRLSGRNAAITSEFAGTTRDVIEVRMDLNGLPVTLLDTAGIRESEDQVELLGIQRAEARAAAADLRVFLLGSRDEIVGLAVEHDDIVVLGKADTGNGGELSGLTGQGVDCLIQRIASVLERRALVVGVAIRERHRVALEAAQELVTEAVCLLERAETPELVAQRLRFATSKLEGIIGRVGVEDLLDEIFTRFCLGK